MASLLLLSPVLVAWATVIVVAAVLVWRGPRRGRRCQPRVANSFVESPPAGGS